MIRAVSGPVIKYPGAKWRIADWIVSHMPEHDTYLEPYFGSGAVFFRKAPSRLEVINDLSGDVVNLFRVIRERPGELAAAVEMTPWARQEYESSYERTGDDLEDARRFLVRCWQAHGSRLRGRNGWRCVIANERGPRTVPYRQWQDVPVRILESARRLKGAQLECRPALDVIRRYGLAEVLIYADPPYVLSSRDRKQYQCEMDDADHLALLDALDEHPGPVLLSAYDTELYTSCLSHWHRVSIQALAEKGRIRTEVLWINKRAASCIQLGLFDDDLIGQVAPA